MKIPVFRVTQPYINLLVEPRIFFMFSGKSKILYILKGKMPFKMDKIAFFPEKICVPTLHNIFRPVTLNQLIFLFIFLSDKVNDGYLKYIISDMHDKSKIYKDPETV